MKTFILAFYYSYVISRLIQYVLIFINFLLLSSLSNFVEFVNSKNKIFISQREDKCVESNRQ